MRYYIDYFFSLKRFVILAKGRDGQISVVAGYATRRQAETKLNELRRKP